MQFLWRNVEQKRFENKTSFWQKLPKISRILIWNTRLSHIQLRDGQTFWAQRRVFWFSLFRRGYSRGYFVIFNSNFSNFQGVGGSEMSFFVWFNTDLLKIRGGVFWKNFPGGGIPGCSPPLAIPDLNWWETKKGVWKGKVLNLIKFHSYSPLSALTFIITEDKKINKTVFSSQ